MRGTIHWDGTDEMLIAILGYQRAAYVAIHALADYIAPILESIAKSNAAWTDRTANARQTLRGYVDTPDFQTGGATVEYPSAERIAEDIVTIFLSHGMDYGMFLELAHSGRYAIIAPTLQAHYATIEGMLNEIFR